MLKESAFTRSCGSEGSFEHERVRMRGTESPDVYIFGDGRVSYEQRVSLHNVRTGTRNDK